MFSMIHHMAKRLAGAIMVFYRALQEESATCTHHRIHLHGNGSYCPDCGEFVRFVWASITCQRCNSRRGARRTFDNRVVPVERFCRQCGHHPYRVTKTPQIDAQWLPYAVGLKEIIPIPDPAHGPSSPRGPRLNPSIQNPYGTKHSPFHTHPHTGGPIVEGQVMGVCYI